MNYSAGRIDISNVIASGPVKAANLGFTTIKTTTQGPDDSTTNVATTAFVSTAVNAVIGGATNTYDTLSEIQGLLNTDAGNLTTFVNNTNATLALKQDASAFETALALKAPLSGPNFSGAPKINGVDIATTAYVTNALSVFV